MVTSLEFNPIDCATILCRFGRTRNGYVDTHFILFSSRAKSEATGDHIAVPERYGQDEEPASIAKERTKNQPSSAPKM